jgi:phosphate-selective porin OprO/OprP
VHSPILRPLASALYASLLLLALAGIVRADDESDSDNPALDELRSRIDALEQQNNILMQSLRQRTQGPIIQVGGADLEGPLGNEELSGDRLQSVQQDLTPPSDMQTQDTAPMGPGSGPIMTGRFGRGFVNNGLWFESQDKAFRVHIGGRTQYDTAFFNAPADVQNGPGGTGRLKQGTDFRRARIRVEGTLYEQNQFCVEYDFVNSVVNNGVVSAVPAPLDLWWNFSNLPVVGNIRIGNQKEPFGFERMMSSRFLNFMERSYNQDAFYSPFSNGFSPGIQAFDTAFDQRMTWSAGVFQNITNVFVYDLGADYAETGRLTYVPWYQDNGYEVLHLGVSGRNSAVNGGITKYRVRGPERTGLSGIWPTYAAVNNVGGTSQQDLNFELIGVYGPWTLQSEYDFHFMQDARLAAQAPVGTLLYQGGYVELSYFLTGEHREYVRVAGLFDRVVPNENAAFMKTSNGILRGMGAWQLGFRYNYLSLDNKGINGGILNDYTWGLSWFLNPNMKLQWNYSITQRNSVTGLSDGMIQGFGMRMAHDF